MKLIRNTLAAGIAVAAITLGACSSQHGTGTSGSNGGNPVASLGGHGGQDNLGSVGMHLTIGNGVHVNSLNWTISNGTNSYTGTVNITDDAGHEAQSVEFVAGGILAGGGYIVTLTGSDSAGDPCNGASAVVTVVAGATSNTTVLVTCTAPTDASVAAVVDTGSIAVDAGVVLVSQSAYHCPGITSLSISPEELLPPETAALTSLSTPGSGGVETILWTSTCGTITNPTSANATFACGSVVPPAQCTVTLTVGLNGYGADGGLTGTNECVGSVYTVMTELINCEAGGSLQCFAPTPNLCTPTDGGAPYCANLSTDNSNCGTCGTVCTGVNTCSVVAGVAGCNPPPAVPCTGGTAGNNTPAGCVPCTGNTSGVCTPTEQLIVKSDIAQSKVTGTTLNSATSCYLCLVGAGGLDDSGGDTGNECGDVTGSVTLTGETGTQACLDTLGCMITNSCDTAAPPSLCLCGSAAGSACLTAGAANGLCLQNEINGLDIGTGTVLGSLVEGDPTNTQKAYTNKALGSGMANAIGAFAFSNCATQCGSNL